MTTFPGFPSHDTLFRLDGRTAFVSGAAGHLGRPMAIALAQAGAHVILNGRTEAKLEALRREMADAGLGASVAAFDVMDRPAFGTFFGGLGRLDVLVNNAFTGLPRKNDPDPSAAFRTGLDSGVTVAYEHTLAALPAMEVAAAAVGHASVINITSIYGHVAPTFSIYPNPAMRAAPYYAAAKGGLLQLTRYLACDLAAKRIRVNSLSPGIFPWDNIVADFPEFVARAAENTPMGRTGLAEEIGGPAVFLASDASSYMTGADLRIDGGWVAR